MGNTCCNRKKEKKKIVLLLVGLDNAGKSVAVKGLAGESLDTVVPTVGLSVVYLKYKDFVVKVFDLGGGSNIRGIWQRYFVDVHGVVFVVDSSDYPRLDEAKEVLQDLLSHEKISGKPVLLLANKQDQQDALDELDLVEKLQLESLVNKKQCPTLVESCSATDIGSKSKVDPGIQKGYRWLLNYIVRDYQKLNARVERDVKQQEIEEREARLEKIERLRKLNEVTRVDDDIIESFSDYDRKLNGEATSLPQNSFDDQKEIFYIHTNYNQGDTTSYSSSRSNESFPHTYYATPLEQEDLLERPKSAVQLVKQHLEHESMQRRSSFMGLMSNKTAPVHLYGVRHPQSASERREHFANDRRALKSAGDSTFFVTTLPNAVLPDMQGDDLHRELFHLNNFQKRLPPLKVKPVNDQQWMSKPSYKSGGKLLSYLTVRRRAAVSLGLLVGGFDFQDVGLDSYTANDKILG